MTVLNFSIAAWQAWAPDIDTFDRWLLWAKGEVRAQNDYSAPKVDFLPAMQRRRLSPLARMAFHVGWPLAEGSEQLPLVFYSRHGETGRTAELLQCLANAEPLSPTQFGLSVHNAIIGQWSILRGETAEMTALSGGEDGFEQALIEAALLLQEHPQVLLIVAEEQPAPLYAAAIDDIPHAYALGLLLSRGSQCQLSWQATASSPSASLPNPLNWLRHWLLNTPAWQHHGTQRSWSWQCHRAQ